MEIYIVRHGETVWNVEKKMQGKSDIELNEKGRELAGRLGEALENVHFDRIYASPLIRAYETACLIRGHRNIPIIRDERLIEIGFGELEGSVFTDWLKTDCAYRFFFTNPDKYVPAEGGETLQSVKDRTQEFLREVIEPLHKDTERIMIVAHGCVNKGLMCHIEGNDLAHYWGTGLQKNCEATIFSYDGQEYKLVKA